MLDVSTPVAGILAGESLRIAWLVNIADTLFLTDHAHDLVHDGETYISQGDVLALSPIVRERGIKLQDYSITLSGVDGLPQGVFGSANFTGHDCTVYLAFPAADGTLASDHVISLYKGTFHSWTVSESAGTSRVVIKVTSPWAKPDMTAGRITSNDSQTQTHAGDRFFEFAHEERRNIGWGGKA